MIIYHDIIGKLTAAGYNTNRIREEKLFSQSCLQYFRTNKPVNIQTLEKVCKLTGCKLDEIVSFE